jgi:alcohol dehydrogenase/L-iditol 2-dehydrogenase
MPTQPAVVQYATTPNSVELREVAIPDIDDDDVLLAVGAVSVCGSDVHQAHGTHSWTVAVPVTLGHEFGGTIARCGRRVSGFREGDRVVSETAAVICGTCMMCRSGRYNLCPSRRGFGYGVDGAMAAYVKVPARCLHHVPDTLSFDLACLTEPHAVAYHAMCVNACIRPGDVVVVLGPGPIGLLCTRMAALAGAHPLIVAGLDIDRQRLETAKALGATHTVNVQHEDLETAVRDLASLGADVVCDASGSSRTLQAGLQVIRPEGQVVKVGWSPEQMAVNLNPLVLKNVGLQGSFSHNWPMWERVIHLIAAGLTRAELLVGMRAGLDGWADAFEAMHQGRVIKSVLIPEN